MTLQPKVMPIFLRRCLFVGTFSLLIVNLLACHNRPSYDPQAGAKLQVKIDSPERIRFSGKGAGAGIMLMSALGVAGIAVGVAIDEGIGKDINNTALDAGFDIDAIVRDAYQNAIRTQAEAKLKRQAGYQEGSASSTKPLWGVKIVRYGFVASAGDDDPSVAQLHMHFFTSQSAYEENKASLRINYPENFELDTAAVSLPLETLKTKGNKVIDMHAQAMAAVMARWLTSE